MQQPSFAIRAAEEADCAAILGFIRALARFEQLEDQVRATEEGLRESLFHRRQAEVLMGEEDGVPVAFALFFHNCSFIIIIRLSAKGTDEVMKRVGFRM